MYSQKVKEFTEACEENLPKKPSKLSEEKVKFIVSMVESELDELKRAENLVDQVDAFADIIYYILNQASKNGIDMDPIFSIVHEANMRKLVNGKPIKREDGKIMKPSNWEPPEPKIKEELKRQKN